VGFWNEAQLFLSALYDIINHNLFVPQQHFHLKPDLIWIFLFISFISDILDYNTLVLPTDSTGNPMFPPIVRPKGTGLRLSHGSPLIRITEGNSRITEKRSSDIPMSSTVSVFTSVRCILFTPDA